MASKPKITNIAQKTLLFSASLAAALGIALEAKPNLPKIAKAEIDIAPRDQVQVDTDITAGQLAYLKAKQATALAQTALDQTRQRLVAQTDTARQVSQLLTVQLLTIAPSLTESQKQQKNVTDEFKSQVHSLDQQYQKQTQQVTAQQQQVTNYDQQFQDSQNSVIPGQSTQPQVFAAQAYYGQQRQIAQAQLRQLQQALAATQTQQQSLETTRQQRLQRIAMQLLAGNNRRLLYQAKLKDLEVLLQQTQLALAQTQKRIQQALGVEDRTFQQLLAIKRQHSILNPQQEQTFAKLPGVQAPQYMTVTRYQNLDGHTLKAADTALEPQLQFAMPQRVPGYALDLDRSILLTDQEVVGSLRDLMEELETQDPLLAIAELNASPVIDSGHSRRAILNLVYQRQMTLITKYQVTQHAHTYQIEATKIDQDKSEPQFDFPPVRTDYRVDWAHSQLKLDDQNKNFLSGYLVSAQGNGPEALKLLNAAIAANGLAATRMMLTYAYVPVTAPLPGDASGDATDQKTADLDLSGAGAATLQSFGQPAATSKGANNGQQQPAQGDSGEAFNAPQPDLAQPSDAPVAPSTSDQTATIHSDNDQVTSSLQSREATLPLDQSVNQQQRPLFKSQSKLTQDTPKTLFGQTDTGPALLGTYGIRKIKQDGHLLNRTMPRKY